LRLVGAVDFFAQHAQVGVECIRGGIRLGRIRLALGQLGVGLGFGGQATRQRIVLGRERLVGARR
jgi:hypothetical protein